MHYYNAFDLNLQSAIYFPELLERHDSFDIDIDVRICFGNVSPEGLPCPTVNRLFHHANETELWLHIPNVARFLISDGQQITIQPLANCDEKSIRLFVLGSCMGALLMQRNLFILHANAIKIGSACVSFAGYSGAGKSTLSGALYNRGYSVLADDVCAINSDGNVLPSFPQIKLWSDAAKKLDIKTASLRKIRPNIEKFAVPLGNQFHDHALPLKMIYLLQSDNLDNIRFEPIHGMHKLNPLKNNTYRRHYMHGLVKEKIQFQLCGKIASQVKMVKIIRPNVGFQLDELVDSVEKDMATRGLHHASD